MDNYLKYYDGKEISVGDKVDIANGQRVATVTNIFSPEHDVSIYYEMENGCVEITPNSIYPLPLEEDIELIERKASGSKEP